MGLYISHPSWRLHDTGAHPENANRLVAVETALDSIDWMGLERTEAPRASREQLIRVHSETHVSAIESFCAAGGGGIDLDTVAVAESWEAALRAAGGAAAGAERLLGGDETLAFVGMRPPGHHAEHDRAMGFCLFNNAAVAAAHALEHGSAERVLILDWDVHHGNGTEQIFASRDDVFYVSIHQSPLYPGTGAADYSGVGDGHGYTLNLPVVAGAGSQEFLALVQHVVAPVAREYAPDLLIISAGYDAHRDDPLASCTVETAAYGEMAATIRELGAELEAPVLVCLEGGYAPVALAASVVATINGLDGAVKPEIAPAEAAEPHLSRLREAGRVVR